MSTEEQLNLVLKFLDDKDGWVYSYDIRPVITSDISDTQLDLLTDQLSTDGYITKKIETGKNVSKIEPPFYCRITHSGRQFLSSSSNSVKAARPKIITLNKIAKVVGWTLAAIAAIATIYQVLKSS